MSTASDSHVRIEHRLPTPAEHRHLAERVGFTKGDMTGMFQVLTPAT